MTQQEDNELIDNNLIDLKDDLYEESEAKRSFLITIIFVVVIISFLGTAFYFYNSSKNSDELLPVITKDNETIKIQPENPGGMEFPNMDKNVYSKISPYEEQNTIERILPPAEEPITKEELEKTISEMSKIDQEAENDSVVENAKPSFQSEIADQIDKEIQNQPEKKNQNIEYNKILEEKIIPLPEGSNFEASDFKNKPSTQKIKVQLASYKLLKDAKKAVIKFKEKKLDTLNNHNFHIEKKDIPKLGTFYRVQIDSLNSEKEASEICKKLKSKNIDCFTVRR